MFIEVIPTSSVIMGNFLGGIIYTAMIKVYEIQGNKLNNYWDDLDERQI